MPTLPQGLSKYIDRFSSIRNSRVRAQISKSLKFQTFLLSEIPATSNFQTPTADQPSRRTGAPACAIISNPSWTMTAAEATWHPKWVKAKVRTVQVMQTKTLFNWVGSDGSLPSGPLDPIPAGCNSIPWGCGGNMVPTTPTARWPHPYERPCSYIWMGTVTNSRAPGGGLTKGQECHQGVGTL